MVSLSGYAQGGSAENGSNAPDVPATPGGSINYVYPGDRGTAVFKEVTQGEERYVRMEIEEGYPQSAKAGSPELPYILLKFAVPANTEGFSVAVTGWNNETSYSIDNDLYPVQAPRLAGEGSADFTGPDYDLYAADSEARPKVEVVSHGYMFGNIHLVTVAISPYYYNYANREITGYSGIEFALNWEETENSAGNGAISTIAKFGKSLLFDIANFDDLDSFYTFDNANEAKLPPYILITSRELMPSFKDLITWKRQKGYKVIAKTVDEILAEIPRGNDVDSLYDDAPARIRTFLRGLNTEYGPCYVTIGGDATHVPARMGYSYTNFGDRDWGHFPSDWYYAELNSDWDSNKNGIFGECDNYSNNDAFESEGEHFLSRIPCKNDKDLSNYIYKLILYENNPGLGNSEYLSRGAYFSAIGFKDSSPIASKSDRLNNFPYSLHEDSDSTIYPTGQDVIKFLNDINGFGYLSFGGHGNPKGIQTSYYGEDALGVKARRDTKTTAFIDGEFGVDFDNTFEDLKNSNRPFFMYANSCTVMPYDNMQFDGKPYLGDYNVASSLLCGGNYGAVGFVGNSREGWVGTHFNLEIGLSEYIGRKLNIGKAYLQSKIFKISDPYSIMINHLGGDCEYKVWRQIPENRFNIEYNGDRLLIDAPNSRISCYDGDCISYLIENTNQKIQLNDFWNKSVSIWNDKHLPTINLYMGNNDTISGNKNFIVNEAYLGGVDSYNSSVFLKNCSLNLHSYNKLDINEGFEAHANSTINLDCDGNVTINGGVIKNGAKVTITAKSVNIRRSFKVAKGGNLIIKQK